MKEKRKIKKLKCSLKRAKNNAEKGEWGVNIFVTLEKEEHHFWKLEGECGFPN
jgi:hypothetical protein